MKTGAPPKDDPQYGILLPIPAVPNAGIVKDGETLTAGGVKVTAHFTPGHTPGGTSWTWQSCEKGRCLNMVYADSVSAVSADDYLFTKSSPHIREDFEKSFTFLNQTPCDILITPHPEASDLWQHLKARSTNPDALVDANACKTLATGAREKLKQRLESERGK
jgi:metallo-beta-lactamase class B